VCDVHNDYWWKKIPGCEKPMDTPMTMRQLLDAILKTRRGSCCKECEAKGNPRGCLAGPPKDEEALALIAQRDALLLAELERCSRVIESLNAQACSLEQENERLRTAMDDAEGGLKTVLESGDWPMPDHTAYQLQGTLEDLRAALRASREAKDG